MFPYFDKKEMQTRLFSLSLVTPEWTQGQRVCIYLMDGFAKKKKKTQGQTKVSCSQQKKASDVNKKKKKKKRKK